MKKLLQFLGEPQPITAAVAGLLSALLGLFLLQTRLGVPLENLSYDLSVWLSRDRRAANAPTNVVIVYIDNPAGTVSTLPDRSVYAKLLERVKANGARLVVFDIAFLESQHGDTNFAEALRRYSPVVIGAEWSAKRTRNSTNVEEFSQQFGMPTDLLRDAATNVGLLSISATDNSGAVICRTMIGFKGTADEPRPTIGRLAAELAGGTNLPNLRANCWLNYYGPAFTLPHRTLAETLATPVDEIFQGKVVFVGADPSFRPDKPDHYGTPYSRLGTGHELTLMPGVEIHATTFCNLLARDWLSRPQPWLEWVVILGWLGVVSFIFSLFPNRLLFVAGVVLNTLLGISLAVTQSGFWWPWLIPTVVPIFAQMCVVLFWKCDPEVKSDWLIGLFQRRKLVSSKTVVVLDLVDYSQKAERIEEGCSPESVQQLNDQIQGFVDDGLKAAGVERVEAKVATTGDGAILVFNTALEAHRFAEVLHRICADYNQHHAHTGDQSDQRWFRAGAATGDIFFVPRGGSQKLAGRTVIRATRLEAGGQGGQTLVDIVTFDGLPSAEQRAYQSVEYIVGKHGIRIPARRYVTVLKRGSYEFEAFTGEPYRSRRPNDTPGKTGEPTSQAAGTEGQERESTVPGAGADRMGRPPTIPRPPDTGNTDPQEATSRADGAASQTRDSSGRPKVFISYSHHDKRFLTELQMHLKPYERNATVTAWSDEHITTGALWPKEIKEALQEAKVAVLLVSHKFLASEYIHEHEFRPLLEKARTGQVRVLWVPIEASSFQKTPLKEFQPAVSLKRPLAEMRSGAERSKAWVKVCEEIEKALNLK